MNATDIIDVKCRYCENRYRSLEGREVHEQEAHDVTAGKPAPRLRLTYWVPTQYSVELSPVEVAAKLRHWGWTEAAEIAEKIARGVIAEGDATDDNGDELGTLAYAIRKTDDGSLTWNTGEPVDTDDAETYHVYVGEK